MNGTAQKLPSQKAFTLKASGFIRTIITPVKLVNPIDKMGVVHATNAIWDTGATNSAISKEFAGRMGLVQTGITNVAGVHGINEVPTFIVNLEIMDGVRVNGLVVSGAELGEGVDVLIGMDIINIGDFAITHSGKETLVSFRIPSGNEPIDYVKNIDESNLQTTLNGMNRKQRRQAIRGLKK